MQRFKVGVTAALAFTLLFVTFMWWLSGGFSAGKAKAYTHMHCSDCALEATFNPALEGKPCPQCGPTGPKMVATVGPKKGAQETSSGVGTAGNIFAAFVLALALTTSSLYAWAVMTRTRSSAADRAKNRMRVCHCPFCTRKIGYSSRQIGATGRCPRCKTGFTLPEGVLDDQV